MDGEIDREVTYNISQAYDVSISNVKVLNAIKDTSDNKTSGVFNIDLVENSLTIQGSTFAFNSEYPPLYVSNSLNIEI